MRHRIAKVEDSEILGELNHQLIKDEGHRNSMTTPELIERMRTWLISDYRASIFEDDSGILAFWRSVGFTDYSLSLEIFPNSRPPGITTRMNQIAVPVVALLVPDRPIVPTDLQPDLLSRIRGINNRTLVMWGYR